MQMKTGRRVKKVHRAADPARVVTLSVIAAVLAVLILLLVGRSRAFATVIPDGYALEDISALTAAGSGITVDSTGENHFLIENAGENNINGFITLARVSQSFDLSGYTFHVAGRAIFDDLPIIDGDMEHSFYGIGNEEHPFKGSIVMADINQDTVIGISGRGVLFNNLSNEASIITTGNQTRLQVSTANPFALCDTLTITDPNKPLDITGFRFAAKSASGTAGAAGVVKANNTAGLVAARVIRGSDTAGDCTVNLTQSFLSGSAYELQTTSGNVGGLFGTIEAGASVSVKLPDTIQLAASTNTEGHAGLLVGENKGSFTVANECTFAGRVEAAGSDKAAGLIGRNGENGFVLLESDVNVNDFTVIGDTYAGGVVGKNDVAATLRFLGNATLNGIKATGEAVGGVAGSSDGVIAVAEGKTCTVSGSTFTATDTAAGGTVGKATAAPTGGSFVLSDNQWNGNGHMGGFIGDFTAAAEVTFDKVTVSGENIFSGATEESAAYSVGGYFGLITANAPVTLTADAAATFRFKQMTSGDFGGIVGKAAGDSAITVSGSAAMLTAQNVFENADFSGNLGGVAGAVGSGAYFKTDKLSVTNTMTDKMDSGMADLVGMAEVNAFLDVGTVTYKNASKASVLVSKTGEGAVLRLCGALTDDSDKSAHLVRTQKDSLLYADNGFAFTAVKDITGNDVGNYGQILRNDRLGIIRFDEQTHKAEVTDPIASAGDITLSSAADAAKLAITLQTHGVFRGVTGTYKSILSAQIQLSGAVDLTQSGVEQFTCANETEPFTGTVNGNGHTLTLDIGRSVRAAEPIGILTDDANERCYMGAFSAIKDATVNRLTIAGSILYYANIGEDLYIGGLAGYASGAVTITESATVVKIELDKGEATAIANTVYVGGFAGRAGRTVRNGGNIVADQTVSAKVSVTGSDVGAVINHKSGYTRYNCSVYIGGAIGSVSTKDDVAFKQNRVHITINQAQAVTDAYVGGCIADLDGTAYVNVDMTGTNANGTSVISHASKTAGGLIGHTFRQCRLTLNGNWAGSVNAAGDVGGLLYKLEGKLTVENGFSVNGGSFTSAGGYRGILLSDGTNAFVIIQCGSDAYQNVSADGFDLFAGKNIREWASYGVASIGGLVTVETGESRIGRLPDGNDGWYALIRAHNNVNTRYYFNIAHLEGWAASSTVSTQADLIYWNVYDFIYGWNTMHNSSGGLPNYVIAESFPNAVYNIDGATADVDLTGYCFYPTKKEAVKFDFSGHKLTFGGNAQSEIKQFRGMQGGIFSDVTASVTGTTRVTFANIELAGTLAHVMGDSDSGGSGAFVCGKIEGFTDTRGTAKVDVNVSNVFFSGLKVDDIDSTNYRPLLINNIGSYVDCKITKVTQYTKDTYSSEAKQTVYGKTEKAASSLIGQGGMGGKLSEYLHMELSEIVFAGDRENTIFTRATLFNAINCTESTSALTYNFTREEDWVDQNTHICAVTYGTEISGNEKQYRYYDDKDNLYVNPTAYPTQKSGKNEHFTSAKYMPYVSVGQVPTNGTYLHVNWTVTQFDGGWGTYENPYLISRPEQLTFLRNCVNGVTTSFESNWKINYPNTNNYRSHYEYSGNGTSALTPLDGGAELTVSNLLTYLRGAYYAITVEELTIEASEFDGIGNSENPFHGVIAGNGNTIIHMPAKTDIGAGGYGLINVANGCAVYGLEIRYTAVGLSNSGYIAATYRPFNGSAKTEVSHFGGVIGWIVGGDNVIDHVTVTVDELTAGHKTGVFGGYVGLVTGGGVTVRNLGAGVEKEWTDDNSPYYYYNPYVGKVLCGYALSDEGEYANTNKNFAIPYIASIRSSETHGSYSGTTFTIRNADDLYMLSFAVSGGAFSFDHRESAKENSIAYGSNKTWLSRHGDYSKVGTESLSFVENSGDLTGGRYEDDTREKNRSLFTDYFGDAISNIKQSTGVTLNLTEEAYDVSRYPNAFRGLGSPYSGKECFTFSKVKGIKNEDAITTVKLGIDLKQYYYDGKYEADSAQNLAFVIENSGNGSAISFENIQMSGKVSLTITDPTTGNEIDRKNSGMLFCLAGFTGYASNATFTNVAVRDLTVHSPGWAAGLVASEMDNKNTTGVNGYTAENLKLEALQSAGAVYAFLRASQNRTITGVTVRSSDIRLQTAQLNGSANQDYNASVGGLIGFASSGDNNKSNGVTIKNSTVENTSIIAAVKGTFNSVNNANAGGFVGLGNLGSLTLESCTLNGTTVVSCSGFTNGNAAIYPTAYTQNALSVEGISEEINRAIAYMLSNSKKSVSAAGNSGGFAGRATGVCTLTDCSVRSDAAATVILGYKNAVGFVGEALNGITYVNPTVQATHNPVYILGRDCAAGLTAWTGDTQNTAAISDVTVAGSGDKPVYILGTREDAPASGLLGDMKNTAVHITGGTEISHCVISGSRAAGLLSTKASGGNVSMSNVKVFDNFIQGYNDSAAGVLNTAFGSTTIDGLYLGGNVIRHAGKNENTGCLADTVDSGAVFTGYDLLLRDNDADCSTAYVNAQTLLSGQGKDALSAAKANRQDRVGLITYQNQGTVNILAISTEDEEYPSFAGEAGTDRHIIFAGFGAPTVFAKEYMDSVDENGSTVSGNKTYTPADALADHGPAAALANGRKNLNGDAVTRQNGRFTPVFQTEMNGKMEWEKPEGIDDILHGTTGEGMSGGGLQKLSDLVPQLAGKPNGDLPVLRITGETNDTVSAFLNLITNNGYGNMGGAFTLSTEKSGRYKVNKETGVLSYVNDQVSIAYDGGQFVAGVYDDLQSQDEMTFSILTLTFAAGEHTYSMDMAVYYPQILEFKSAITAIEGEVYKVSSFLQSNAKIDISAGSKFSFYAEYAYNKVANNIENYNFEKRIVSGSLQSFREEGTKFTAGTKLILLDLNSKTADGFRGYFGEIKEGQETSVLDLSSLMREDKRFQVKTLPEINEEALNQKDHLIQEDNFSVIERYLVVVIPPESEKNATVTKHYNLWADVKENEKNIIVLPDEKVCTVSVWKPAARSIVFEETSLTFSNTLSEKLKTCLQIDMTFEHEYLQAMNTRTVYGTHVFSIQAAHAGSGKVALPRGTVVKLTDPLTNKVLQTTVISTPTTSVVYSLSDIIAKASGTLDDTYADRFELEFDFSGVSPLEFNTSFANGQAYTVSDEFYLSGDSEHFTNGVKAESKTNSFKAKEASPIKIAVVPENRKHLAINFGDLNEATDDGLIRFTLDADFSALIDSEKIQKGTERAKVEFSVLRKEISESHLYPEGISYLEENVQGTQEKFAALTAIDGAALSGNIDQLEIDGENRASAQYTLKINVDAIQEALQLPNREQAIDLLTNYRLVAKVTFEGTKEDGETITKTAEGYFVFLLCNIYGDIA